jgi:hypothetical protein
VGGNSSQQLTVAWERPAGATAVPVEPAAAGERFPAGSSLIWDHWLSGDDLADVAQLAAAREAGWVFAAQAGLGHDSFPWATFTSTTWVKHQWNVLRSVQGGGESMVAINLT